MTSFPMNVLLDDVIVAIGNVLAAVALATMWLFATTVLFLPEMDTRDCA